MVYSFVRTLKIFDVAKAAALLSLSGGYLTLNKKIILDNAGFHLYKGDKVCLIGRNGCGKSTLLKILAGKADLEDGEIFLQPGASVTYLAQMLSHIPKQTAEEFLLGSKPQDMQDYQIQDMMKVLQVAGQKPLEVLSGGEMRRVLIVQTLTQEADIFFLDEPTNHLDITAIEWLEDFIQNSDKTFVIVAHDRSFLKNTTQKTLWLEGGVVYPCPHGYKGFEQWQEEFLEQQQRLERKFNVKMAAELRWLARGITARRSRNEGRLRRLKDLRAQRAQFVRQSRTPSLEGQKNTSATRQILEAWDLSCTLLSGQTLFKEVNFRILKGDRLGIIGPNGCGKSTLLSLLMQQTEPTTGAIRKSANLEWAFFRQNQPLEELSQSVKKFMCPQGDYLDVQGKARHVVAYLKEFLFTVDQVHQEVGLLSGGERNRLRLAKILAQSPSLLVLDEPTNDLDMETLDFLKNFLLDYPGTLLIVSHDRDFLDDVVSCLLVFEEDGKVREFSGSFSDYLEFTGKTSLSFQKNQNTKSISKKSEELIRVPMRRAKMPYHEVRLLEVLPGQIEGWQKEKEQLEDQLVQLAGQEGGLEDITSIGLHIQSLCDQMEKAEDKWLMLLEKQEALEGE